MNIYRKSFFTSECNFEADHSMLDLLPLLLFKCAAIYSLLLLRNRHRHLYRHPSYCYLSMLTTCPTHLRRTICV